MTLSERLREVEWSNPIAGEAADALDAKDARIKELEGDCSVWIDAAMEARERAQRAEALAESFRKDAERYSYIKDDRRGKFVEALALRDAENWDAAIDSAREALK